MNTQRIFVLVIMFAAVFLAGCVRPFTSDMPEIPATQTREPEKLATAELLPTPTLAPTKAPTAAVAEETAIVPASPTPVPTSFGSEEGDTITFKFEVEIPAEDAEAVAEMAATAVAEAVAQQALTDQPTTEEEATAEPSPTPAPTASSTAMSVQDAIDRMLAITIPREEKKVYLSEPPEEYKSENVWDLFFYPVFNPTPPWVVIGSTKCWSNAVMLYGTRVDNIWSEGEIYTSLETSPTDSEKFIAAIWISEDRNVFHIGDADGIMTGYLFSNKWRCSDPSSIVRLIQDSFEGEDRLTGLEIIGRPPNAGEMTTNN